MKSPSVKIKIIYSIHNLHTKWIKETISCTTMSINYNICVDMLFFREIINIHQICNKISKQTYL